MSAYAACKIALANAAPGATLIAGSDVMVKLDSGLWYRREDNTVHDADGIADFHGHSGYSITDPEPKGSGS